MSTAEKVVIEFSAETARAIAAIKDLAAQQKTLQDAVADTGKRSELASIKAAAAVHLWRTGISVLRSAYQGLSSAVAEYQEDERLAAQAQGRSLVDLKKATRGLIDEDNLLKLAGAANASQFKVTNEQLNTAASAVSILARKTGDYKGAQEAVTKLLVEGKTRALAPYGIAVDGASGSTKAFTEGIRALGVVAEENMGRVKTKAEEIRTSQIGYADAIDNLKGSFGRLAIQLTPLLNLITKIVNKIAEAADILGGGNEMTRTNEAFDLRMQTRSRERLEAEIKDYESQIREAKIRAAEEKDSLTDTLLGAATGGITYRRTRLANEVATLESEIGKRRQQIEYINRVGEETAIAEAKKKYADFQAEITETAVAGVRTKTDKVSAAEKAARDQQLKVELAQREAMVEAQYKAELAAWYKIKGLESPEQEAARRNIEDAAVENANIEGERAAAAANALQRAEDKAYEKRLDAARAYYKEYEAIINDAYRAIGDGMLGVVSGSMSEAWGAMITGNEGVGESFKRAAGEAILSLSKSLFALGVEMQVRAGVGYLTANPMAGAYQAAAGIAFAGAAATGVIAKGMGAGQESSGSSASSSATSSAASAGAPATSAEAGEKEKTIIVVPNGLDESPRHFRRRLTAAVAKGHRERRSSGAVFRRL